MLKYFRIPIGFIYLSFTFFFGFFLCLLRPFNPHNSYICGRMFSGVLSILGIKVCLIHPERLDAQKPCVFISNHQHNIDLCIFGGIVPRQTVTVGKKSLFWIPFFGQLYYLAGNILINRVKRSRAVKSLDKATEAIKNGLSIWIMPEGTRSKGRGLLPFKKGPFYMAKAAECVMTPICLSDFRSLNINKLNAGTIYIEVLKPVNTLNRSVDEVKEECFNIIKNKCEELNSWS